MKILEPQSAALTNYELLMHLNAIKAKPRNNAHRSQNVETVLKELHDYLTPSGSSQDSAPLPPYTSRDQYSPTTFRQLMERLKPFKLTKAEVLMMINLRPSDLGLLDCVIEECDLRFTEEQQVEMLEIVGSVLGRKEEVEAGDGDMVTDTAIPGANGEG